MQSLSDGILRISKDNKQESIQYWIMLTRYDYDSYTKTVQPGQSPGLAYCVQRLLIPTRSDSSDQLQDRLQHKRVYGRQEQDKQYQHEVCLQSIPVRFQL